jgi:hypothetical protein
MIDAEMYGMMLRAKIDMRLTAPPANMSSRPRIPPDWALKKSATATGSSPGSGR